MSGQARQESGFDGQDGIYLEIGGRRRGRAPLSVPVEVKGLSAGGVVLTAADASGSIGDSGLEGQEALILLPRYPEEELGRIAGRVLWTRPAEGQADAYVIALELAEPDLRVRQALEERLKGYPRDFKELWDQWDRVHARRFIPSGHQAIYAVAVGAMAGGTALYFLGPENLKLYGSILAIYGCLMMAAKSAWAMWQDRTVSEE
ncbi:MAG: PilZ domain-containing protein [Deltaproteobacteria bacterium]|nr:PilZ domain-containing protein [Deltaproteobacteria bacterium]